MAVWLILNDKVMILQVDWSIVSMRGVGSGAERRGGGGGASA